MITRSSRLVLVAAALAAFATPTLAQDDRYRLERTDTGYIRLDTRTGAMSVCEETSGNLVCRMAADERAAFEAEIERLEGKIDGLDKRLAAVENSPLLKPENLLPSDEQIDKSLDTMEKFFRRFMEIVRDAEGDATKI